MGTKARLMQAQARMQVQARQSKYLKWTVRGKLEARREATKGGRSACKAKKRSGMYVPLPFVCGDNRRCAHDLDHCTNRETRACCATAEGSDERGYTESAQMCSSFFKLMTASC